MVATIFKFSKDDRRFSMRMSWALLFGRHPPPHHPGCSRPVGCGVESQEPQDSSWGSLWKALFWFEEREENFSPFPVWEPQSTMAGLGRSSSSLLPFPDCLPHFRIRALQVCGELSYTRLSFWACLVQSICLQFLSKELETLRSPDCQAWQPDFYFRDPHGIREQTPAHCSLASVWYSHDTPPTSHTTKHNLNLEIVKVSFKIFFYTNKQNSLRG